MPNADEVKHALSECQALHANGKYQQAEALALWCIAQSQSIEDDLLLFRSYSALGHVLRASERFSEALNVLTTALTLAQAKLDHEHVAKAWNSIGVLFLDGCAWGLAMECFYKVIADTDLCHTASAFRAHNNMALCHLYCGNVALGLAAIHQALRMAPADEAVRCPYSFMFMRYTLVQLSLKGHPSDLGKLADTVAEARHCRALHPDNRSVDVLCDLVEGSVKCAYAATRTEGVAQLYAALDKARFVPELLTDVLGCLTEAELLAGRADQVTAHLEAWIARTYDDAGWQAAEKLGLHSTAQVGRVLQEQWPELPLGDRKFAQRLGGGPPLPPGVVEGFLAWLDSQAVSLLSGQASADLRGLRPIDLKDEHSAGVRLLLMRLAEGHSYLQLSEHLGLTAHSTKSMFRRLYQVLQVSSREEAIAFWQQNRTALCVWATRRPGSRDWYFVCLLRREFEDALALWYRTPPRLRDSQTRLVVCLMLCLLKRDDHAAREAALLLPTDAAVFVPFSEWWEGCEASLSPLLVHLQQGSEGLRLPVLLALYFGCTLRKQYAQAATVVSLLLAELGTAPALSGEGGAPHV